MSSNIYISKLRKSKEMLKKEKLHTELNVFCRHIKILLAKANVRQRQLYNMLLPIFKESGLFCHNNGQVKSFSTFKKHLNIRYNELTNVQERKNLLYFILDHVLRAEDIEYIWTQQNERDKRKIRKLNNMIESDYEEPINLSDETLKEFIKELETKGLKIDN